MAIKTNLYYWNLSNQLPRNLYVLFGKWAVLVKLHLANIGAPIFKIFNKLSRAKIKNATVSQAGCFCERRFPSFLSCVRFHGKNQKLI